MTTISTGYRTKYYSEWWGCVYMLSCGDIFKIGYTQNLPLSSELTKRRGHLRRKWKVSSPINFLFGLLTPYPKSLEKHLHKCLADREVYRQYSQVINTSRTPEVFFLSEDIVKEIHDLQSFNGSPIWRVDCIADADPTLYKIRRQYIVPDR